MRRPLSYAKNGSRTCEAHARAEEVDALEEEPTFAVFAALAPHARLRLHRQEEQRRLVGAPLAPPGGHDAN